MKYKVLIFDLDDTLIDNMANIRHAFKEMVKEQNEVYSEENFLKWYEIDKKFWANWQDGLIELPEQYKNETGKKSDAFLKWLRAQRSLIYFESITLERAIYLNDVYMRAMTEVVIPLDGAYDALEYLTNKGYYILIATNGPSIATKDKLEKIGCLQFVKDILSADMFGYMKPKREFFEAIQNRLNNFNKEEYLIIGDSLKSDIGFGMSCGFDSCWFNSSNEELSDGYKPTMIIEKLIELKDKL